MAAAEPTALQTRTVGRLAVSKVAEGLAFPWSIAFLPDGQWLVAERGGALRRVNPASGQIGAPIAGVPPVWAKGQGGLFDVVLAPDFAQSGRIYFAFAEEDAAGAAGTALATARLVGDALQEVRVLFRALPKVGGAQVHFGGRIVLAPDDMLFLTLGDRGQRDRAQNPAEHLGKLIRLKTDGSVPADNPWVGRPGHVAHAYNTGHRNVQGAAFNPATGTLFTHEHGAQGGDEINIERPGINYGWPVTTKGVDYSGEVIGPESAPGMEEPQRIWTPSIAPSGMAFYTGDLIPGWKGDMLVGALRGQMLLRIDMHGDHILAEERYPMGARIRDVRVAPDGAVILLTDAYDGAIWRLAPPGR